MSMSRHCAIYKTVEGEFYLELADREYAGYEESDLYGPFSSETAAEEYLDNFSNPGGIDFDEGRKTPKRAPNGTPIKSPKQRRSLW